MTRELRRDQLAKRRIHLELHCTFDQAGAEVDNGKHPMIDTALPAFGIPDLKPLEQICAQRNPVGKPKHRRRSAATPPPSVSPIKDAIHQPRPCGPPDETIAPVDSIIAKLAAKPKTRILAYAAILSSYSPRSNPLSPTKAVYRNENRERYRVKPHPNLTSCDRGCMSAGVETYTLTLRPDQRYARNVLARRR